MNVKEKRLCQLASLLEFFQLVLKSCFKKESKQTACSATCLKERLLSDSI